MSPYAGIKYRPEIDGLRAFAVAPVILFHAGFSRFQGGFVGVDVFFVISGYLISTIILEELKSGTFSITRFYERRARRILPALFVVVVACLPFAWMWMLPREMKDFGQSVAAVALFSSNLLFWLESGYFERAAELKPLLHTWSLAVEEQFYVGFPLLLWWLWRPGGTRALVAIAALAALSLAVAQWGMQAAPSAAFFLLPTRAWELGVGALAALTVARWRDIEGWRAEAAALLGLGAILLAVFAFSEASWVPGISALLPVLGTAAIIMFARPSTFVGRLLALRPIVGLGLISYSAYLWHQPLFAFARLRQYDREPSQLAYAALIALALFLAYLTWLLVERPFRDKAIVSRRQIFASAAVSGCSLLCVGSAIALTDGAAFRLPQEVNRYLAWAERDTRQREKCDGTSGALKVSSPDCLFGPSRNGRIDVWGDSHAMETVTQLSNRLAPFGVGVRELTHHACMPISDYLRGGESADCIAFRNAAYADLTSPGARSPVVLMARWTVVFDPTPFDNGEGGREPRFHDAEVVSPEQKERRAAQLRATVESLLNNGRRVVLVYPIPEVGWHVPNFLAYRSLFSDNSTVTLSTSMKVFESRTAPAVAALDGIPDHPGLLRFRPSDLLCNRAVPGRCVAQVGETPLYFDDDHLSMFGAGLVADAIVAAMKDRGWLPSTSAARPTP